MVIETLAPVPSGSTPDAGPIVASWLGRVDYHEALELQKRLVTDRAEGRIGDQLLLLEHPPVVTLGRTADPSHIRVDAATLAARGIEVVRVERGGEVTYHGPGQIIAYLLLDMRRLKLGVRDLVRKMEGAVVDLLSEYRVDACGNEDAPGVYVGGAKIAALGLKIKNGCCYHGLALNVSMDLAPFMAINPCGYTVLRVTQTSDLGITDELETLQGKLAEKLRGRLEQ